jgi:hypothetical protein
VPDGEPEDGSGERSRRVVGIAVEGDIAEVAPELSRRPRGRRQGRQGLTWVGRLEEYTAPAPAVRTHGWTDALCDIELEPSCLVLESLAEGRVRNAHEDVDAITLTPGADDDGSEAGLPHLARESSSTSAPHRVVAIERENVAANPDVERPMTLTFNERGRLEHGM